jgi:hypothetical protein
MYEKLKEKDIEFLEFYHDPIAMAENVMPININAPADWNEETDCVRIRPYQFAMMAYDTMYEDDFSKSDKDNFTVRKGAGNVYNISARNIGKTFLGLVWDDLMAILVYPGIESCIASFDQLHLKEVSEKIANFVENHKLYSMLKLTGNKDTVGRSPHRVHTKHGHLQIGVNEKVGKPTAGESFHGKHYKRFSYDEASYMSEAGTEKRIDSGHSEGYVERLFGIPDLRVGSPLGQILRNPKNRNYVCRLPQYVREDWDDNMRETQAEKYGGESSMAYKLNVMGELSEGAFGKYDMERIRKKSLNPKRKIKFSEASSDIFKGLDKLSPLEKQKEFTRRIEEKVIVDRLPCDQVIVASDIGTGGSPSEVAIFFRSNGKWRYEYQISLFKMIVKEQTMFFKWLYDKMGSCYMALDCSNMDGDTIRQNLLDIGLPAEHFSRFRMSEKIEVDIEKDEQTGKPKRTRSGQIVMKSEFTKEFGVQCLESILYSGDLEVPYDEKFLREFAGFLEVKIGNRSKFTSTTTDHLHDSFLLFALAEWHFKNEESKNLKTTRRCLGFF